MPSMQQSARIHRADGLIRLSTRLKDCEVRYGSKTESGRKGIIQRFKACVKRTSWKHATTDCSAYGDTRAPRGKDNVKLARLMDSERYVRPEKRISFQCAAIPQLHKEQQGNRTVNHAHELHGRV